MERLRAHRFELDPTDRQRTAFRRAADLARKAYNWGLAERERDYRERVQPARERGERVRSLTTIDQMTRWRAIQDAEFPWAREFSSRIPRHALIDLDRAYQNWWAHRARHPRYKAKNRARAAFRLSEGVCVDARHVALPRMGAVRLKGHPDGRVRGTIKQATVSEMAGRWYVSLLVSEDAPEIIMRVPASDAEIVGVDVGLRHSLVLSTGEVIQGPRALKANLIRLRRAQQALARSQRSSARRRRKVARVARLHARVANIRRDWQHRVSDDLTCRFAVVGHEDLNVRGLSCHRGHNGRSWADLGIAELFRQLDYKAAWRGNTIVVVDRWYPSSKTCSACGARNTSLKRGDETFVCPACGIRLDRDLNAAINLRPVAVIPPETQNARRGNVRPRSAPPVLWQIPLKREPAGGRLAA